MVARILLLIIAICVLPLSAQIIVLDTDATPDSLIAIATALSTAADVRLITVSGTGTGASLASGVANVQGLLALMNREDVVVAGGATESWSVRQNRSSMTCALTVSLVQSSSATWGLPPASPSFSRLLIETQNQNRGRLLNAFDVDLLFGSAADLPVPSPAGAWSPGQSPDATTALTSLIRSQPLQSITYIALSTLTNLADFLSSSAVDVRGKLKKMHFVSGEIAVSTWLGSYEASRLPLTSQWNVLVDPAAASFVFHYSATSLIRYIYPLDAIGAIGFSEVRFRQYTADVLGAVGKAKPHVTWLATMLTRFRNAVVSALMVNGNLVDAATASAAFYDMFGPRSAFVVLVAVRDDIKASLDSTPVASAWKVLDNGVLSQSTSKTTGSAASTAQTQSFLFQVPPTSLNPFWTALRSVLLGN